MCCGLEDVRNGEMSGILVSECATSYEIFGCALSHLDGDEKRWVMNVDICRYRYELLNEVRRGSCECYRKREDCLVPSRPRNGGCQAGKELLCLSGQRVRGRRKKEEQEAC